MAYRMQKVSTGTVTTIAGLVATVLFVVLVSEFIGGNPDPNVMLPQGFAMVVALIFAFSFGNLLKKYRKYSKYNYDWYKETYPEYVSKRGTKCCKCGDFKIRANNLMRHTYTRAHYCVSCGHTLFYSPELTG